MRSIGETELWVIAETAKRLAADLRDNPSLIAPPIPGPVPFEGEKPFVLAEEQRKLWSGKESDKKGFNLEAEREKLKAGGKVL